MGSSFPSTSHPVRRLLLVGSMGSGKSTVGRALAAQLGALHVDADELIATATNSASAGSALTRLGEREFRVVERRLLDDRSSRDPAAGWIIWSTGGGALRTGMLDLDPADTIVWLDADESVLWQRIDGTTERPLATDRDAFRGSIAGQRDTFMQAAHHRVDAAGSVNEVCDGIIQAVGSMGESGGLVAPLVQHDLLARVNEIPTLGGRQLVLLADIAVAAQATALASALGETGRLIEPTMWLSGGESTKDWTVVDRLVRQLREADVTRDACIIAMGGGTVTDVVGWMAAILGRGTPWVAVPTTLVGQVDAAIGGKTGINHAGVKNALGSIHQPSAVLVDPALLETLPRRDRADGMVELVKTAMIAGPEMWREAISVTPDTWSSGDDTMTPLIAEAALHKTNLCAGDEHDLHGRRAVLNLGHTVGHAIESATNHAVSHGRAVAIGMDLVCAAAVAAGALEPAVHHQYRRWARAWSIDLRCPCTAAELEPWIGADKKRDVSGLRWVIAHAPGDVRLEDSTWTNQVLAGIDAGTDTDDDIAPRPTAGACAGAPSILVLNGVNLGDLGDRPASTYGTETHGDLTARLIRHGAARGITVHVRQTDDLALFLGCLRDARARGWPVVINPGAWTHTERAVGDALEMHHQPVIELHISDPAAREEWRHESVVAEHADHCIAGHGTDGYIEALDWLATRMMTTNAAPQPVDSPA